MYMYMYSTCTITHIDTVTADRDLIDSQQDFGKLLCDRICSGAIDQW